LEERIFGDGSNPIIIFEPTGITWLVMSIYLKARHPDCRLVRVQGRKGVALRKYLHRSSKSDKIDALTLAKMSFIDSDRLEEVYLPPEKIYTMHRLARQRKRLESEITTRKTRIGSIIDGYLPSLRKAFLDPWSAHAKAFLSSHLNPIAVVQAGEKALHVFLTKERHRGKSNASESHMVFLSCKDAANIYENSMPVGTIGDSFFTDLQDEISREIRIMEMMEVESDMIARRLEELYLEFHPCDNLRSIPGVGEHTAPIFLATIGDPARFRSQSAFANYSGVVPAARQSSQAEAKGLRMTKAGPATLKWALYQASQIGRRCDPQLASVYYREMVHHDKNHKQSMGAVMSHLGARVLSVLWKNEPYELRDTQGNPITSEEARRLILSDFQVPEEIRRERRRHKTTAIAPKLRRKRRDIVTNRAHEAAGAPQPVIVTSPGN
jgi:transposase